jgi:hypothetical protein
MPWLAYETGRLGANKDELVEAIRLGLLTGGSLTIPTVGKAYELLGEVTLQAFSKTSVLSTWSISITLPAFFVVG